MIGGRYDQVMARFGRKAVVAWLEEHTPAYSLPAPLASCFASSPKTLNQLTPHDYGRLPLDQAI